MNRPRYAPITSHLLVRKGEAKPWQVPGSEGAEFAHMPENIVPVKAEHSFTDEELQSAADYQNWKRTREADAPGYERRHAAVRRELHPAAMQSPMQSPAQPSMQHDTDEHSKRLTLRLTPAEYERLGIIGVKRDMTRQQLLRHAIDCYLAAAKAEYQASCGCLAGDGCRGDC
jgi:hypothetical protein